MSEIETAKQELGNIIKQLGVIKSRPIRIDILNVRLDRRPQQYSPETDNLNLPTHIALTQIAGIDPENAKAQQRLIVSSKLADYLRTTKADIAIIAAITGQGMGESNHPLMIADAQALTDQLSNIGSFPGILLVNIYCKRNDEPLGLEAKVRHLFAFTSLRKSYPDGREGEVQIFAGNLYWHCGKTLSPFERWSAISCELVGNVHQGSRRYFFSSTSILKQYMLSGQPSAVRQKNLHSYRREATFFSCKPPALTPSQEFIDHQASDDEACIAFRPIQGQTLLELMASGSVYDHQHIILGVLKQLAVLEKHSLYYDDLRPWNVVISGDGRPALIDYGAISRSRRDVSLPSNIYLAFLCFVRDVAVGRPSVLIRSHVQTISPYGLPDPYRYWAVQLWQTPISHWNFEMLYRTLKQLPPSAKTSSRDASFEWMRSVDEALTRSARAKNLNPRN
jgi:hypothetical protein